MSPPPARKTGVNSPDALFTTSVTLLSTPNTFFPTANKKFKRGRSSDFSWQSLFHFLICKHIYLTYLALAGLFQVWYFSEAYCMCVTIYVSICILKKRKERGKNHSVSNNEHVHLFASGLHTQFSQKARADHDLAFDISCLQARGD